MKKISDKNKMEKNKIQNAANKNSKKSFLDLSKKRFLSWNVNGIRAIERKGNFDWLVKDIKNTADIICLQETKAHPEQLSQNLISPFKYRSIFDHSKLKKGYSGVAIYLKDTIPDPEKIEYGVGVPALDQEGRMISLIYSNVVIINCYFPNGGGESHRFDYKLEYYKNFLRYCNKHRKLGKKIIFCGDLNVAHNEIDLARPKENSKHIGFLPVERAWVDSLIQNKYVDVFRHFYPNKKDEYTWWDLKTFSRDRNIGWRMDYFFVDDSLMDKIKSSKIFQSIQGSDHCPIDISFK